MSPTHVLDDRGGLVGGELLALAGLVGVAERRGTGALGGEDPARETAAPTGRRAKTGRKLALDEEAQRWPPPDLVRFFIATGERRGEALGAHRGDFDAEAEELVMDGNIIRARGTGTVRNSGRTEGSGGRDLPLPGWCAQMLEERREALGDVDPDTSISTNARGDYLNAANFTNRVWLPFRRRAGYGWVAFRTFRKIAATLLDGAGPTAREIADPLGRSNPSMTPNTYAGPGADVPRERRSPRLGGSPAGAQSWQPER